MVSRMGLVYISVVMVAVTNANNVIPQVRIDNIPYNSYYTYPTLVTFTAGV